MIVMDKKELATLLEIVLDCTNCESLEEFYTITYKIENILQSAHLVFLSAEKGFLSSPELIQEINVSYPTEWTEIYRSQNYIEVDPIIKSRQTGILYWKDIYLKTPPNQEFYSQAKSYGIANGFSHIIFNQQIFGLMSVAGDEIVNSERSRYIINNLAPHFHQLVQYLRCKKTRNNLPSLTPREREVLLWAMEGKSNWEISVILGISQESIKGHIANTLRKLGASNRAHAVAIALQYNLLFPFGLSD